MSEPDSSSRGIYHRIQPYIFPVAVVYLLLLVADTVSIILWGEKVFPLWVQVPFVAFFLVALVGNLRKARRTFTEND